MSKESDKDLVAILLPRDFVEDARGFGKQDEYLQARVGWDIEKARIFGAACRKALRPPVPYGQTLLDIRKVAEKGGYLRIYRPMATRLLAWLEYSIEQLGDGGE